MSFRASHYFVSFMSEASLIAAGFGCSVAGSQVLSQIFSGAVDELLQVLWHYTVTQPHNIEVPRSLVEVVVSWNLPMHRWLKQYVFKQVAAPNNQLLQIIKTDRNVFRHEDGLEQVVLFLPPMSPRLSSTASLVR